MKKLCFIIVLTCLTLITACNGASGDNTSSEESAVVTSLTLITINSLGENQQSFDKDNEITLQATVLDSDNYPIANRRVNFNADLGSLSTTSSLTNESGIAQITISNPDLTLSAGTASATIDTLNETVDYEFVDNDASSAISSIALQMKINGSSSNQLKADQQAQILITLTDENNQAVANELVTISADVGTLSTTTALTKANGIASVTLSSDGVIGAGVITASLSDNSTVNKRMNYEIVTADSVIDDDVRIGYFDANGDFLEGKIATSITNNTISAGGTLGLYVDLIDSNNAYITAPTPVTFTSNCVSNSNASVDETVFTIRGKASATFEDINCAGLSGTDDVVIASVTVNGNTKAASAIITIDGEQLGSIEFVSSAPNNIVLKGSGGQETSTLTFIVKSALGNVLPQQEVNFSLDTNVGNISLSRSKGLTNSQGLITTQVIAGTTPTVVRVTASATMTNNGTTTQAQTQSSQLSINTGLPEQSSFTLAASTINPEASNIGEKSTITAWLADSFNNPVADGTDINFTTEGGSIVGNCTTVGGSCSVEWTSNGTLFTDHRSTILATASGHETFFDTNGNNTFDENDGSPLTNSAVSAGFARQSPLSSGFIDMSEAWRDDNENFIKDSNEVIFLDDDGDGEFSKADGKFNGPQCSGDLCDSDAKKATLRKAIVLVMSDAYNPSYILSSTNELTVYQSDSGIDVPLPSVSDGSSLPLKFRFADSALQTLPLNSTVSVALEGGELTGTTSYTVGNTHASGYQSLIFTIENEAGNDPETARLIITIKTPKTSDNIVINKEVSLP
ncbi:Ig-like domain-containing protein [Thalassotalea piscium]